MSFASRKDSPEAAGVARRFEIGRFQLGREAPNTIVCEVGRPGSFLQRVQRSRRTVTPQHELSRFDLRHVDLERDIAVYGEEWRGVAWRGMA